MMPKTKLFRCLRFFSSSRECKPFEAIPSPKRWPIVGHLHLFSKFGPYSMLKITDAYRDLNRKYGPVALLETGVKIVLLFDPEDIKELFRNEGKLPSRPVFEVLRHYRKSHRDMYNSGGLITENGEDWWKLRRAVNWMLRPESPSYYLSDHEQLAEDFVQYIRKVRDKNNEVHDFLMETYKFTMEAGALLCLGRRFGTLEGADKEDMFGAVHDTLDSMMKTLLGLPVWKVAKTPTYKKLERAQNSIYRFIMQEVEKAKQRIVSKKESIVFLEKLMKEPEFDNHDITLTVLEILTGGIDATGITISFLLYNLAKNPNAQEKLYQEVKDLKNFSGVTNLPYLKACLKENNRLNPATGASARILHHDVVFSGYNVPKGVLCMGIHPVIGRMQDYFSKPELFLPERWLREGGKLAEDIHPYALLPFGHGVRRCVGQRIAEQEIYVIIAKMIQNFHVEFPHGEVSYVMRLQLVPDRPMTFCLRDRSKRS